MAMMTADLTSGRVKWTTDITTSQPIRKMKTRRKKKMKYKAPTLDESIPKAKKSKLKHIALDSIPDYSGISADLSSTKKAKAGKGPKDSASIVDRITAKYDLAS